MIGDGGMTIFSRKALTEISAEDLGCRLRGFGVNILVRKSARVYAEGLRDILGIEIIRAEDAFALVCVPSYAPPCDEVSSASLIQIHADFAYGANPYLSLLPENDARGVGVELHLFETDPDMIVARAEDASDWTVLQSPEDKPHGVRECYLLDSHGYSWVVSKPLKEV